MNTPPLGVQIAQIAHRGVQGMEHLQLSVLADTNLVYYLVLATQYVTPTSVAQPPKRTYWFTNRPVRAGDLVFLYSGFGQPKTLPGPNGRGTHFIYWGLSDTLWNRPEDCAVLMQVSNWTTTLYGL